MHQPIVSVAAVALSQGRWVHLFPEGRINYDGRLGPLRWGVGKLVCEARQLAGGVDPVVLPFYHSGRAGAGNIILFRWHRHYNISAWCT